MLKIATERKKTILGLVYAFEALAFFRRSAIAAFSSSVISTFLSLALNVRNRYFRPEDPSSPDFEEERENYMDCLEKIYGMGCTEGAVTLGDLYRDGDLGLKQDYDMAFTWYSRAAIFGDATGYERMYGMLCDGRKEEDRNFMDQCVINSVHCDSDVLLEEAVKIYRSGRLTEYAVEMERYFIPMLEAQEKAAAEAEEEDDEDDYPDDDGRYDAYV